MFVRDEMLQRQGVCEVAPVDDLVDDPQNWQGNLPSGADGLKHQTTFPKLQCDESLFLVRLAGFVVCLDRYGLLATAPKSSSLAAVPMSKVLAAEF